jgi:hypothetical protein
MGRKRTKNFHVGENEKVKNQKTILLTREKRIGTKTRNVYRSKIITIMGYLKDNGFQFVLKRKEMPHLIEEEVGDEDDDVDDDDEGVLLEHEDVQDLDINLDLINDGSVRYFSWQCMSSLLLQLETDYSQDWFKTRGCPTC